MHIRRLVQKGQTRTVGHSRIMGQTPSQVVTESEEWQEVPRGVQSQESDIYQAFDNQSLFDKTRVALGVTPEMVIPRVPGGLQHAELDICTGVARQAFFRQGVIDEVATPIVNNRRFGGPRVVNQREAVSTALSTSVVPGIINVLTYFSDTVVSALLSPSGYSGDCSSIINSVIAGVISNGPSKGATIHFPACTYNCFSSIVVNTSNSQQVINLVGDGAGNTVLNFTITTGVGLDIIGPPYNGDFEEFTLRDICLVGSRGTSYGLNLTSLQFINIIRVQIRNFAFTGIWQDIVGGTIINFLQQGNASGLLTRQQPGGSGQSPANEMTFIDCHAFGQSFAYNFTQAANIQFIGGSIENHGTGGAPALYGIQAGNVLNGLWSLSITGMHFETSFAPAYIILNGSTFQPVICNIDGCDFYQNPGGVGGVFMQNMISVVNPSGGTLFTVNVTKCGFGGYLYTPSSSRLSILQTGPNITLNLSGNLYMYPVEIPVGGGYQQDGIIKSNSIQTTISNNLQVNGAIYSSNMQLFGGLIANNSTLQSLSVKKNAEVLGVLTAPNINTGALTVTTVNGLSWSNVLSEFAALKSQVESLTAKLQTIS